MTNKQIIIDGVDVHWCEHYTGNIGYLTDKNWTCRAKIQGTKCEDWSNCYFKNWRRKEQECDELKKIINEAKNSKLDLNSFFAIEATVGEYQLELDQLKADRKEALEQLEFVRTLNTVQDAENRKLSKTLTEIKEIAESYNHYSAHAPVSGYSDILQKISECEGNDGK